MRAMVPVESGEDEPVALAEAEVERPEPGAVEVLVRVHATGVNPADVKILRRLDGDPVDIPGFDVSGVVEEVGPGVRIWRPGDEVFGMIRFPHPGRTAAEYATSPPRHLARKPAGLDHVRAAALPLVSLTAWQALIDTAGVRPGQRVLVHAAAGGVGHVAVQLAKELGAYVAGTASAANHDFVAGLGADEVVDYTAVAFDEVLDGFDVVIDTIGGDYTERSLRVLRDGGSLVCLTDPPGPRVEAAAARRGIAAGLMLVEPDQGCMRTVARLAEEGRLRAEIDSTYELADIAKAHERVAGGHVRGKVVVTVA